MKYIGNKSNLLEFIETSLQSGGVPLQGSFTDLFSGTTSVAEHFKKKGLSVISNDFMTYSYVMQKAFIESNCLPKFEKVLDHLKIDLVGEHADLLISYLNSLEPVEGYFFDNYGAGGIYNRMYFTRENACQVDSIRDLIQLWFSEGIIDESEFYYLLAILIDAADHVANMSGTYGAYLKIWRSVALKKISLKNRQVYNNAKSNLVFQEKAEDLIKEITGDILYLDPPYNSRQYAPNFHVLESLAVWDKQMLSGKTGLRNYDNQKSDFSSKVKATEALSSVVESASFKYIALSYNNEGIIPQESIDEILGKKGKVQVFVQDYKRFRTERDHEKRHYKEVDDKTQEFLYLVTVK